MTTERANNNWIMTFTGKKFWPLDPKPEDIDMLDVAHALHNLCRYTGHCKQKISVLQHCILVQEILSIFLRMVDEPIAVLFQELSVHTSNAEILLAGLAHDVSESYINDLSSPLKYGTGLEGYNIIEHNIQRVIEEKFGLTRGILNAKIVKYADQLALSLEAPVAFDNISEWNLLAVPEYVKNNLVGFDYFGGSVEDYLRRFTILEEKFKESKNGKA